MGRDVRLRRLLGILVVALALTAPALASAAQKSGAKKVNYDAVYTTSNDPSGNSVIVFSRAANGMLTQRKVVSTGGKGIKSTAPFGFPIVDSSGSVNLTADGKLLFVVNSGDNSVSSFQVTASGPKLVSHVSSHGKLPISLTSSGDLLYVVNETSANIYGWKFSSTGKLTPIAGSNRKLTAVTPKGKKDKVGVTAGIGFANNGGVIVVTQRGLPRTYGEIDTFVINKSGAAAASQAVATPGIPNPFGFSASGKQIFVSNAGFVATPSGAMPNPTDPTQFNGTAATYNVSSTVGIERSVGIAAGRRAGERGAIAGCRDRMRIIEAVLSPVFEADRSLDRSAGQFRQIWDHAGNVTVEDAFAVPAGVRVIKRQILRLGLRQAVGLEEVSDRAATESVGTARVKAGKLVHVSQSAFVPDTIGRVGTTVIVPELPVQVVEHGAFEADMEPVCIDIVRIDTRTILEPPNQDGKGRVEIRVECEEIRMASDESQRRGGMLAGCEIGVVIGYREIWVLVPQSAPGLLVEERDCRAVRELRREDVEAQRLGI